MKRLICILFVSLFPFGGFLETDVNGDGSVTASDARLILRVAAKLN